MTAPSFRIEGIIGEDTARAAPIAEFLAANPGPVEVVVNSPGGDAFEGAAMKADIEHHGHVTAIGEGIVASAASLLLMGGAEIILHRDTMFMIHDPAGLSFGPADTHRRTAATLDKIGDVYASAYARASGNPVARVKAWMREETWLTAEEAVALNFADRIEESERIVACAAFDFTRFRNAPASLVRMAQVNGWATASPDAGKKETTNA